MSSGGRLSTLRSRERHENRGWNSWVQKWLRKLRKTAAVTGLRELVLQQLTNTRGLPKRRARRTRPYELWIRVVGRKGVSILLCKRPGFVFGDGSAKGRGSVPSLAQPCRKILSSHDAILSRAGIRSGHRIVKWFKVSRQWWMGIVHFFAAYRSARNSNFNAASSLGNPPTDSGLNWKTIKLSPSGIWAYALVSLHPLLDADGQRSGRSPR